jgi:allantoate deiminase
VTAAPLTPSAEGLRDAREILRRCDVLAGISSMHGGIERAYLTEEHADANRVVAEWMAAAGMSPWQDAAGNQRGSYAGADDDAPVLILGSHLDTVPNAGRYDGILGVLTAIAVVARLNARGERLPVALEVVGFADEEGTRFGATLLGSRALAGTWNPEWFDLRDEDGITMRAAFDEFGLDADRVGEAALDPARVAGYLEAHIEQGPYLEDAGRALGVVRSIAGARRFALSMTGHAGHAGGVPWDRRRDALVGASELVVAVETIAREAGAIATVGRIEAFPGAVNVIPGRVEFSLDLRAEEDWDRDKVWDGLQARAEEICAARGLTFEVLETHAAPATRVSRDLRHAIEAGIRAVGDPEPMEMYSRAGHDAMAVATMTDYAMLFVRCGGGGVSHHPDESVLLEDVALAVDAFEVAVITAAG